MNNPEINKILYSHYRNGSYKCPQCGAGTVSHPEAEAFENGKVQVWCHYGCGYIWISKLKNNGKFN